MTAVTAWVTVALMALSASTVYYNMREQRHSNQLIDEVSAIQIASEQLTSDLLSAETGQWGYLLTGDNSYLIPYHLARENLIADLARISSAPLATPSRKIEVGELRRLTWEKLDQFARTIQLHDAGQTGAALELVKTDYSNDLMRLISVQTATLEANARARLLRARVKFWPWHWLNATMLFSFSTLLFAIVLWAKHIIERGIRAKLYRLKRFTRAFGLSKGTLLSQDGRILFWNGGTERFYGYTEAEAVGKRFEEMLQTNCSHSFEEIYRVLLAKGSWQGEFVCRHKDGREMHVMSDWTLSRGEAGEPDVVIEISTDITPIKRAQQEREAAHALLQTVMEAAPGAIYAKDRDGRMIMANASARALTGKPWSQVEGRTEQQFLDDEEQGARICANDQRIMERGEPEEFEEEVGGGDEPRRIWSSLKAPLRDAGATVIGLIGVSVDITDRRRNEDRLLMMVNELNHRVKNTLATVQAIASQTLRSGDAALRDNLESRLMALAAAYDVLTRQNWEGADLHELVARSLMPFGGLQSNRFDVQGPRLRLVPRAALAMAMGLHELGTNALRHGALSTLSGRVGIVWDVTATDDKVFGLTWSERGGPAVVPPARPGFGIRLIQRILAQDLGGTAVVRFDCASGVVCVVEAPLAEVAAPGGVVPLLRVGTRGERGR
ncbi:PAS domain-containing protein [Acidisoma sp.]|uniref:PAS domain-containing protein n=1 Tax=Acidisoma sp. TaxID=1872115 RepID=UPI003AFF6EF9